MAILALACVAPVALVCWALVRVNLRLAEQNADLLKVNLVLSQKPGAMQIAAAMEQTDRTEVEAKKAERPYFPRAGA